MKSLIFTTLLCLTSVFASANEVNCSFETKGVLNQSFNLTHVDDGTGHSITPFENSVFSGFISYSKGYTVVFVQEQATNHPVSFNGYTSGEAKLGGIIYSADIKTTLEFRCD